VRLLRLGVIPHAASEQAKVEALAASLGEAFAWPVEVSTTPDYRSLVAGLEQGLIHIAWVPPLAVARAVKSGAVVPAAIAVRSGLSTYGAALFSRVDAPITSLRDLRGLRAAWVDRESASGYLVIRASLRAAGLRLTDAFTEELFLRSHAAVARAVLTGRADVGATYVTRHPGSLDIARAGWREADGTDDAAFHVVASAGPIPSDFFAVSKSLAGSTLAALQATLVDARPALPHRLAKELFHADDFVRPTPEHFSAIDTLLTTADPLGPPSSRY
jgi:phosphonate transport system substrate-binding protein